MKKIAAFLLATVVAFSSFAQTNWTPIGIGEISVLSMRNVSRMDSKGALTAELRLDYLVKVKDTDGGLVDHTLMKISMNCFSRESKMLSDSHFAEGDKEIPKVANAWTKKGDEAPVATQAGNIIMESVCPKGSGKFV